MDVVGPLKTSQSGNKVVVCITEHFSKYSRAFALPNQKATTVAKVFVEQWMHVFGQPLMLHAAKGPNFESKLMQEICSLYDIYKTHTTPRQRDDETLQPDTHQHCRDARRQGQQRQLR